MAGLAIIIDRDANGTGPIIPDPLHPAGVDGYNHRYVASDLEAGPVLSWDDRGSLSNDMVPLFTGGGPFFTKTSDAGLDYVRFAPPTSGAGRALGISAGPAAPSTIAAVVRLNLATAAESFRMLGLPGATVQRVGNGQWALTGLGSNTHIAINNPTGWAFVIAQLEGATAGRLRVNSTENTVPTAAWSLGASTELMLGHIGVSAGGQTADYAEVISWGRILDATERAAVHSAMKAKYSVLP